MLKVRKFDEITKTSNIPYTVNHDMVGVGTIIFDVDFTIDENIYNITVEREYLEKIEELSYELSFNLNLRYSITGSGNAFKVFSNVIQIFKNEFLAKVKPETFFFVASEPSRIRLYDHFMGNVKKYLPNYNFIDTFKNNYGVYYLFERD